MDNFGFGIGGSLKMEPRFQNYGEGYSFDNKKSGLGTDLRLNSKQTPAHYSYSYGNGYSQMNGSGIINPNDQFAAFNSNTSIGGFLGNETSSNYVYSSNEKYEPAIPQAPTITGSYSTVGSSPSLTTVKLDDDRQKFLRFDNYKSDSPANPHRSSRKSSSPKSAAVTLPPRIDASGKVKRSRKGCLTCRHRKKRCCESKPKCTECQRLDLPCKWPLPGTENKNRSKNNDFSRDEIKHEIYGRIKVLRGIVDYKLDG
ncbi:unnamed protein product [Kuraishia capsulata CBS 1993]|uniref:Zn(2)-C6 fungal-type domain-containing protein n=1 Tax=Kuraishia capsulata CBS 1993 TaxID=1382522 RepID=W6MMI6_9ASCO|nr:uncharacterized protein KUCA_T00003745001 [Kuraishia capsulata CBS 1993]CDK27766.1 unnamed protein product [Kuraishia capsulata CBS 1993]